jgi:prevent-host-death family protein
VEPQYIEGDFEGSWSVYWGMERSMVMTRMIPPAEAKKQFSAIIKDVEEKFDRFTITKNGVGKAVILSNEEYDGLLETLDILSCVTSSRIHSNVLY